MKQDHEERLAALSERLAEVFLDEADPDAWDGADTPPRQRTKEQRGNRHWELKTANQIGLLFARTLELHARTKAAAPALGTPADPPEDADAEIARHEKEAAALLERIGVRRGA